MAVSLLKHVLAKKEIEGIEWDLNYIRTKDKKEVDFCIVKDGSHEHLIEAKFSDSSISPSLADFSEKLNISATQVVFDLKRERKKSNIETRNAESYLSELFL